MLLMYLPPWTLVRISDTLRRPSAILSLTNVVVLMSAIKSEVPTEKPVYKLNCVTIL